jgi:TonB family protein
VKKERHKYHSIRKPSIIGGRTAFQKLLQDNLQYPQEAIAYKVQGIAHVKCEISDKGKVLKAESIHHLGYGLDEEAERLCLLLQFEDTTERGFKIKHTQTIKIPFVLPQEQSVQINYEVTPAQKKSEGYNYTLKL